MLILKRRIDQSIVLSDQNTGKHVATIVLTDIDDSPPAASIGIDADGNIKIDRDSAKLHGGKDYGNTG